MRWRQGTTEVTLTSEVLLPEEKFPVHDSESQTLFSVSPSAFLTSTSFLTPLQLVPAVVPKSPLLGVVFLTALAPDSRDLRKDTRPAPSQAGLHS